MYIKSCTALHLVKKEIRIWQWSQKIMWTTANSLPCWNKRLDLTKMLNILLAMGGLNRQGGSPALGPGARRGWGGGSLPPLPCTHTHTGVHKLTSLPSVSLFFLYFYCWLLQIFHYSPLGPPPPSPQPPSLWPSPHCCLCLWVTRICSLANPFTFFHPLSSSRSLWLPSVCPM